MQAIKTKRTQLIVALDISSIEKIDEIISILPEEVEWYKIGLELFTSHGRLAIEKVRNYGKKIFLDLKLHDIPNTVAKAVSSISELEGVELTTLHASGAAAMLKAAADAVNLKKDNLKLLAVTVLTSLGEEDLRALGITRSLQQTVMELASIAIANGIHGVVCSVNEANLLRKKFPNAILVTPGIRPQSAATNDQKRVATPKMAVEAGADFIVVGRPILEAKDPAKVAKEILCELS